MSARTGGWISPALLMRRDLLLALRRPGEWLQPLLFFVVIASLFPLAGRPELSRLQDMAPVALWVGALLASLLALELLLREDAHDGSLELLLLSGGALELLVLAKVAVHWLLTGLPLVLLAPLLASALGAPAAAWPAIMLAVLLGTVSLSLLGAIGAALTLGLRRGGALLALLILPLCVPVLVFGARATELAIDGLSAAGPLFLLAALAVLGLCLAPFAIAAAVRIGVE